MQIEASGPVPMRKRNKFVRNVRKIAADPILLITILIVMFSLYLFVILPLFKVLQESLRQSDGSLTVESYVWALTTTGTSKAIINTLVLAAVVGVLATAVGLLFAYTSAFIKMRGKKLFNLIAILPLISPPFAIALAIILLFGSRGLITHELLGIRDANIYGLRGLIFVQTLSFFPLAYLVLNGVLKNIDPSIDEAGRNLGASRWKVFSGITFPLIKPALFNAFLLVFIKSIADFGNPIAIGGSYDTLAVQIYMQAIGNYDMRGAAALSIILLNISLLMFIFSKYYLDKKSYITVTGKASRERKLIADKHIVWPLSGTCLAVTAVVLLLYIMIPIGSLIKLWGVDYSFTLDHYKYAFNVGKKSIIDTIKLSVIATPITGILGMIIAFLLVRKQFFGKTFIDFTTMLNIAVPGTVVGIGFIMAFNSKPFLLTGTAAILIIAFVSRSLPIGVRAGVNSLRQIDPNIEEAAINLGASTPKVFTSITLQLIKPAFFGGLVHAFITSMTSLSAVIFLISAKYKLLTISVLDQVDSSKFGNASAFSVILIVIVYIAVVIMQRLIGLMGVSRSETNI